MTNGAGARAIIFHGTNCKPDEYWYRWLGEKLEDRGYTVDIPYYQNMNIEPIGTFLPKVLRNHVIDEETILIGHSAGASLILGILECVDFVLPQVLLIAGFSPTVEGGLAHKVLKEDYDWNKIKNNVGDLVFINSVNDPWGCDDRQGRFLFDRLGGTHIVREDGHFGSFPPHSQSYPTFDLVNRLIK